MRRVTSLLLALLSAFAPVAARAQTGGVGDVPPDTFADPAARGLVLDALRARDSAAVGLHSYEARVTERVQIGLAVTRRLPLRSRTLYHREQVAHVYWQSSGMHRLRWLGRREGAPVVGDDWSTDAPFGLDFDVVEELSLDEIGVDLLFNPFGDRMDVFDAEFVQPVSGTGLRLYRFRSGDTMQIRLPAPDRTITLVEVVVEARSESWETVEGSLWFDRETGTLVRAVYRPSGVWNEEIREPGGLDDVPGFLKPAIGTVTSIAIEYGLYERQWWLPRRIAGEGEFDWGHGLVRMPLAVEWTMSGHVLNEAPGPDLAPERRLVSVGMRRRGDDERRERIEYLTEPGVDLSRTPDLPPPIGDGPPLAFTRAELGPLIERIEQSAGPPPGTGPPPLHRMLLTSLRYDRVRGLSAAWTADREAGRLRVIPQLRLASAIPGFETTLEVHRGGAALAAYRRLADASDWNHADGLGNSVATLLSGHDGGDYYRVTGASAGYTRESPGSFVRIELFAEAQRPIERQTNVSLATLGGGSLRPNIEADRVDAGGLRVAAAGQLGTDVQKAVFNWRVAAEAAAGDVAWARMHAGMRMTGRINAAVAGALDLSGGLAANGSPVQRAFLLGGVGTIRGVRENAVTGPAFWLTRAEIGAGLPGMRAVGFLDVGWAGARDALHRSRPAAGVGAGVSFMDGFLRLDVARGITRSPAWRVYFQLDAIL